MQITDAQIIVQGPGFSGDRIRRVLDNDIASGIDANRDDVEEGETGEGQNRRQDTQENTHVTVPEIL